MPYSKLDALLNLALLSNKEEKQKSGTLMQGQSEQNLWDIIVKYSGNLSDILSKNQRGAALYGGYAIVTLPFDEIKEFVLQSQVEYVEMPKRIYFEVYQGKLASCVLPVQREPLFLSGKGVLIGIVDSGIDWKHPDFRNLDGTTRILKMWDQSVIGNPPEGYYIGTEYTKQQIDFWLQNPSEAPKEVVPMEDFSGHGTAVLGVAAGNGRASQEVNKGVAYNSQLLVVKLGTPREKSFPRTAELMQGVDYLVRESVRLGMPIAINISFGNNYGSHRGDSLIETYLDQASAVGRNVICVGTGNNGRDGLHTRGKLLSEEEHVVAFSVGNYEASVNLQLWKNYEDSMDIYLEEPSGKRMGPLKEAAGAQRYRGEKTEILLYYGEPAPYHATQEIYFEFLPTNGNYYVDKGVWKVILRGKNIKNGEYFLWLPGGNSLNSKTAFYYPKATGTLTIPSTSRKVISVGAYDSRSNSFADFSGRGSTELTEYKPDLVAPGVEITAPRAGGGYGVYSGTSFSTPFVTGAAALLMEWGIVDGNDPYLYGEKVKAYLRRGAGAVENQIQYPSDQYGWGALCVEKSLPHKNF